MARTPSTNKSSIVFGKHPIIEAIESGKVIEKLLIRKGWSRKFPEKLQSLIRSNEIPVQYVPIEKLNRTTSGNHQGIIGFLPEIDYHNLDDVLPHSYEKGESPLILILDQITDVRNFGAIARTALGTGVHAIIIHHKGSAGINADAIKTSAGALNKIPVCREKDLGKTIEQLKEHGLQIIVTDADASKQPFECTFTVPTAIVLGAEDKGVSRKLYDLSDEQVAIPITKDLESYNVSVAAGMLLYEVMRQRNG